jgi:oligopeptide transport system substrate-binding protein
LVRWLIICLVVLTGLIGSWDSDAAGQDKIFRTNLNEDLQTTDPLAFFGLTTDNVLSQVYEGFTTLTPEGQVAPALATSWQTPDGGLTWRITLRSGVRFHSGREFTADDVRWTLTKLLMPRPQSSLGAFELRRVVGARDVQEGRSRALAGVTVVDRNTVEIRFVEPDALFPLVPFFFVDSGIEAEYGPDWASHVSAGTGPFRLIGWRRGQEVVLAAHHDYWGGPPSVAAAHFAIIPHAGTLLALYDSGALDFAVIPESAARQVLSDPRYAGRRLTFPRSQVRYLGLTQALYPPFRDMRVREALALALDRDAVVKDLYHGAAVRLDGTIPPGLDGYRAGNVPPVPYDPARARRLLAEAGYGEGRTLPPLELTGSDNLRDELTVYAGQLGAVLGIPVGLRILERGAAIVAANQGRLAFFVSGWTADYPDSLSLLLPVWYGTSPFNRSRWISPAFDRLIDQAKTIPDAERRHLLCQEAERVLMADRAMIPLPVPMIVALARAGVTGVRVLPVGTVDFRNAVVP